MAYPSDSTRVELVFPQILFYRRIVRNLKEITFAVVGFEHTHYVFVAKGARSASAKYGDLVAAFISSAVAVKAF